MNAAESLPTVVIADDHAPIRAGLRAMVEDLGLGTVVGAAERGDDALALVHSLAPDILLADQRMPGLSAMELATTLRDECSATRVIVVSSYDNAGVVRAAIAAGASGYIAKDADDESFAFVLRQVRRGQLAIDPRLLPSLLDSSGDDDLSDRQLDVLQRAAMGHMNERIATELGVSIETVKSHMSDILRKLDATSRTEAVAIAIRRALIE
jgi:two-component system, NarL family, response regulator